LPVPAVSTTRMSSRHQQDIEILVLPHQLKLRRPRVGPRAHASEGDLARKSMTTSSTDPAGLRYAHGATADGNRQRRHWLRPVPSSFDVGTCLVSAHAKKLSVAT
jgi:hypothetical protein